MARAIGLAALTVLDVNPVNQVYVAAEAGYSHVGIRLVPATPTEAVYDTLGDTPFVRDIEKALKETGVKVFDVEILRMKPDTRVINFKSFLETAQRLGASQILVAGNDSEFNRMAHNFSEFTELASGYGLCANIEPMPWTTIKDLKDAKKLIDAVNHPKLGVIVDPIHYDRGNNTYADLAAIPQECYHYLQFCDAPKEKPTDVEGLLFQARNFRLCPGTGGIDLLGLLKHMPAGIPIAIECCNDKLALVKSPIERAKMYIEATRKLLKEAGCE